MADRILLIAWGRTVRGREERALEIFNESLGLYGRWQRDGRIASFDICLLAPNPDISGYVELRGDAAQIAATREDAAFNRLLAQALLHVDDLRVVNGYCNEGVAEQVAFFAEAIAEVPQKV